MSTNSGGFISRERAQVGLVHAENPAEPRESSALDLPPAQRREIVAAPARRLDRAPVGRRADVPVAEPAEAVRTRPARPAAIQRGAKHALGRRRAADVAVADEQHRYRFAAAFGVRGAGGLVATAPSRKKRISRPPGAPRRTSLP